ncbi:14792_t:CDS:2 [Dentiscutata erythropus]|uniref:14792_t:CDS:1 n=1 Tax=Dentiscutata erythropus TaxID=1348616 RepID=A0A9N9F9J1_9GLOM|nr:14792_t:CDS:2 [Dentiscutata erythropus]
MDQANANGGEQQNNQNAELTPAKNENYLLSRIDAGVYSPDRF